HPDPDGAFFLGAGEQGQGDGPDLRHRRPVPIYDRAAPAAQSFSPAPAKMRRFYKDAAIVSGDAGFEIQLDGRPVRTPARALLSLPNAALAQAVAEEWRRQGDSIDPRAMPFTGLANAAIDQIAPAREAFAAGVARYAETDLLCYRAERPDRLVARQAAAWNPLLDWARTRYDVTFRVTQGIIHIAQPPETLERLATTVAAFDPFTLAGLSAPVTLSGSLVCGLAVVG